MNKIIKIRILFILLALILSGLILYFGLKTVLNEVIVEKQRREALERREAETIALKIEELLNQKSREIKNILQLLQLTPENADNFIKNSIEVNNLFILKEEGEYTHLLYPVIDNDLTNDDEIWIERITPIINDPILLYSHAIVSEGERPREGWYIYYENENKFLIYWIYENNEWIGFNLSYSYLLVEIIGLFELFPDNFLIVENNRVLKQGRDVPFIKTKKTSFTAYQLYLDYPLLGWKIEYYLENKPFIADLWQWKINLFFMLLLLNLFLLYLYRIFSRSIREALQQVSFVGQVSHELKTPLTNILLYTDLLKEEIDEDDEELVHGLEVISNEGRRLSRLIQNLLTFTRKPNLTIRSFDVIELINEIEALFIPIFNRRGINLVSSFPEKIIIESDRDLISQILGNFLSNAEKYAYSGKQVDIEVKSSDHQIAISVRDYGKGIAKSDLKKIFRPFKRLNNSITEGVAGTGIGLTIAEQLADKLHGSIVVNNEERGVRFTLILSLKWNEYK